ncbi:MAG: hypothetical protein FWB71_05280 [Defluviitaleaceae bacterium]|nr:hypothetical protein [Defluviitaleaceae bacterium]
MLTKIETKEIMTKRAAMEKYRDKYFKMVITETGDGQDNSLGYVIYTFDDEKEALDIPREEQRGRVVATALGVAAEPWIQIGGLDVYGLRAN